MRIKISIVVPFYQGNKYMNQLFSSISNVVNSTADLATYEVILVNDSPWVEIEVPEINLRYKILKNKENKGIQTSRINGLNAAGGDWILFLDQDDEIVADGFRKQISLTQKSDVVVGNGIYNLGRYRKRIYKNKKCMDYLIQEENFLKIRNLIYSPGQCLIKKSVMPLEWTTNILKTNGADDWFLWILLFKNQCKFNSNPEKVYIHNDAGGENLSADLAKMRTSAIEVRNALEKNLKVSQSEVKVITQATDFKYFQDTKQLNIYRIVKYMKPIIDNCIYKFNLLIR